MRSYVFKVLVEPDKFEDGRDAWHASCPTLKVAIQELHEASRPVD
jgi:hypothetical protein